MYHGINCFNYINIYLLLVGHHGLDQALTILAASCHRNATSDSWPDVVLLSHYYGWTMIDQDPTTSPVKTGYYSTIDQGYYSTIESTKDQIYNENM